MGVKNKGVESARVRMIFRRFYLNSYELVSRLKRKLSRKLEETW